MPHSHCFLGSRGLAFSFVLANVLIFLSYTTIAVLLTNVWIKRKGFEHNTVAAVFGLFIFCCGVGHVMAAFNMYLGYYRLETYWMLFTALVSIQAAAFTWGLRRVLLSLPEISSFAEIGALVDEMYKRTSNGQREG